MEPYPVLAQLQGSWLCSDVDLSFVIADWKICHIIQDGVEQEQMDLKLQWADNLGTWQINIPFFHSHDAYIKCINASNFEVLNLSIMVTDANFNPGFNLNERNRVFHFRRQTNYNLVNS